MALVREAGVRYSLSSRLYSYNFPNAAYGSAINLKDYVGTATDTLPYDPDYIFETQEAVQTTVQFLARNIAQIGLHLYVRQSDNNRVRNTESELAKLIANPNPYQTTYDWLYQMVVHRALHERYLAALMKRPNGDLMLIPIPPKMWEFERNALDQPVNVIYTFTGVKQRLTSGRFFWLDGYPGGGNGISAIYNLLQEAHSSMRYRVKLWQNGARISGIVSRPATADDWEDADRVNFMTQFSKALADGDAEGTVALLEDDMTYTRADAIKPVDAEQMGILKLNRATVAANFGVFPMFVGILDDANYSNAEQFRESLYVDTLGSWFVELEQAINTRIVGNRFGLSDGRWYFEFNVDEKLRLSLSERFKVLFQAVGGAPIFTINEVRAKLNMPTLGDEFDELVIPSYIQEEETSSTGSNDSSNDPDSQEEGT